MTATRETAAPAAIRVAGIEKRYGELEVLTGVDLEVAPGSIFALLGSNGAGKTTLVRILATLITADAGTGSVAGFDVATQPARVRGAISLTGQFAAVDEILTGRENLVLVGKLRHLPDPGAVADALLARFRLTDAGGRRAGTYSGGTQLAVPGPQTPGPSSRGVGTNATNGTAMPARSSSVSSQPGRPLIAISAGPIAIRVPTSTLRTGE